LKYSLYLSQTLGLPTQERSARLLRNLLQQMCLVCKKVTFTCFALISKWDCSQAQSVFHSLETLALQQKSIQKRIPPRDNRNLRCSLQVTWELIYTQMSARQRDNKVSTAFVNKILMTVLGFLNRSAN